MSGFFGIIMSSLQPRISSSSLTSAANATTSTITVSGDNNRGTLSYTWQQSGTTCTIGFPGSASTYFQGSSSYAG
jgi:hypothetical protein